MFTWLKKNFIPHAGNEHRPHALRRKNIRFVIVVILFLEIGTFLLPTLAHLSTMGNMAAVLPAVLADLTNSERKSENLSTLTVNPVLVKAAQMKAEDMASKGYFAHTSPEGKTPWYWLEKAGYQYQYAGENLAINFSDSKDVASAWMNSPTHKANIVKGNYTEIGTGVATGIYEGKETVFVAQVYANPLPKIAKIEDKKAGVITVSSPVAAVSPNVLGAETVASPTVAANIPAPAVRQPTFWQKLLASPRNTTNSILYLFFGAIALILFLYLFIKMRNHHMDLITNGLMALAVLGILIISNYYLSYTKMAIAQSLDYSIGGVQAR